MRAMWHDKCASYDQRRLRQDRIALLHWHIHDEAAAADALCIHIGHVYEALQLAERRWQYAKADTNGFLWNQQRPPLPLTPL